jgi:hypothetical protein
VVDDNNEEKIYSNNINLNIHQSNNEKLLIKVRKSSKGKSRELARENASGIDYTSQINDKDVVLDGYFLTDPKSELLSKKDYVKVDLYLPLGKVIYLDRSLRSFLYDVKNIQNVYDSDMVKHYYRITEEGLDCLDCEAMVEDVENAEKDKDPESFNMKIDEDGVHIKVVNDRNEKAEVKVDQNGVKIESTKDSLKVNISND